jgi:hypothetical protein
MDVSALHFLRPWIRGLAADPGNSADSLDFPAQAARESSRQMMSRCFG